MFVCHQCVCVWSFYSVAKECQEKSVDEIIPLMKKKTAIGKAFEWKPLRPKERKGRKKNLRSNWQLASFIHTHRTALTHTIIIVIKKCIICFFFFVHGYKPLDRIDTVGLPCRERDGRPSHVANHISSILETSYSIHSY